MVRGKSQKPLDTDNEVEYVEEPPTAKTTNLI